MDLVKECGDIQAVVRCLGEATSGSLGAQWAKVYPSLCEVAKQLHGCELSATFVRRGDAIWKRFKEKPTYKTYFKGKTQVVEDPSILCFTSSIRKCINPIACRPQDKKIILENHRPFLAFMAFKGLKAKVFS